MKILKTKNEFRELSVLEIDVEARTVKFSVSSEYPVERRDWSTGEKYLEVLSHNPEDVDLKRLIGAPILDTHWGDQIGVIESGELRDGKLHVLGRFSNATERARAIFDDIAAKIRRNFSAGYGKRGIVGREKGKEGGLPLIRFAWEIFEVSCVPVPADPTVGVGRDEDKYNIRELAWPEETPIVATSPTKIIILS